MATPAALRTGLAGALRTAFPDAQVSEYVLSNVTPPSFDVDLDEDGVHYDEAMQRGHDTWGFVVRGYVSSAFDVGSQRRRDEWLATSGASSVKAALETDETLGGVAYDVHVTDGFPRQFDVPSVSDPYTGAQWTVVVKAAGT